MADEPESLENVVHDIIKKHEENSGADFETRFALFDEYKKPSNGYAEAAKALATDMVFNADNGAYHAATGVLNDLGIGHNDKVGQENMEKMLQSYAESFLGKALNSRFAEIKDKYDSDELTEKQYKEQLGKLFAKYHGGKLNIMDEKLIEDLADMTKTETLNWLKEQLAETSIKGYSGWLDAAATRPLIKEHEFVEWADKTNPVYGGAQLKIKDGKHAYLKDTVKHADDYSKFLNGGVPDDYERKDAA
ncbi:hypothetical protein K9M79_06660 [Candidatus Woesearchaeota archaeon]|nr:hypothetical protein [Candidatus Woesearchaeota archaeon]